MRICGVNLPLSKRLLISLTSIKGIGRATSEKILKDLNIEESIRTRKVSDELAKTIEDYILKESDLGKLIYGQDLIKLVNNNIKSKIAMQTRSGKRHQGRLTVRGQKTKRNSRTVRKVAK